jgi:hypothetical protein
MITRTCTIIRLRTDLMGYLPVPELSLDKAFQEWIPENYKITRAMG